MTKSEHVKKIAFLFAEIYRILIYSALIYAIFIDDVKSIKNGITYIKCLSLLQSLHSQC